MKNPVMTYNALWHETRILLLSVFIIFAGIFQQIFAQTNEELQKNEVIVYEWLKLGAFEVKKPAFSDQKNLKGEVFEMADLLKSDPVPISILNPVEGQTVLWKDENLIWVKVTAAKNDFIYPENIPDDHTSQITFLAAYIEAERWLKAELEIQSPQMFEFYLDGELIGSKKTSDKADAKEVGKETKQLKIEKGKHLLLIKTLYPSDSKADWMVKTRLIVEKKFGESILHTGISPETTKNIYHLLNGEFVQSATVSPDGKEVMLRFSDVEPPDGKTEDWAEIRNLESGEVLHTFRHSDISRIKWVPTDKAVSYCTQNEGKTSIWKLNLKNNELKKILSDKKDFVNYEWSPDGSFIIYSIQEKPEEEKTGLKRLEGMNDRWPWWRNRSFLYKLDVKSGASERLTYGSYTTSLMDIHPAGSAILLSIEIPDFSERPYSRQYLAELDLVTLNVDTIWESNVSGYCQYSPNGEFLLVTASATMFGNAGVNLSEDVIPNESDQQAYIFNLANDDVDPLTLNFNPSIQSAEWSDFDENKIYFLANDRTYRHLFVYDMNTRYFEKIETGLDVVNGFSLAKVNPVAVYTGSGISSPPDVRKIDLQSLEFEIIDSPREKTYQHVVFGKTEDWNFTSEAGKEIEGRIYYPPDFDPSKKYPLIVYYYAGTTPTDRSFGGRYPKNMFAAQGYIVYNLQPSGAIGYGQDFSAAHVNNWGTTVADEIIEGTALFLKAHSFVDADRVGCLGASYGGFMTMLLQTRTDLFAAAISHAGISSISSYWGEGYWGYLYSSSASAGSFPWNNKNLYIQQSPLFSADKINTPLLLLHGAEDTNVPVGESIQLYTALKLLGKPVELIEIAGQDHHILDYKKRILWQKTIFAWFDKWLKDQPEWWNDLYPERNL